MSAPTRTLVVWLPDWPVTALRRFEGGVSDDRPIAIVHANRVRACSPSARAAGVRRGQRRRDAQAACPSLRVMPDDPARDERGFLPVLARIEDLAPGVQPLRPGLCALRARGPARYYGGEARAARVLLDALEAMDLSDARAAIADGPFTAVQAARLTSGAGTGGADGAGGAVRIVAPGESAAFLAPLTVAALDDAALAGLLSRLGVQTLGEFAALGPGHVRDRLGERGVRLHALAGGRDSQPVAPRIPPPELAREIVFEPPLEQTDQLAFAVRTTADDVVAALGAEGLVCTEVRIELSDDRGDRSERVWLHPTCFDAADLVDRIRWQLESIAGAEGVGRTTGGPALRGGVAQVRIAPEAVDEGARHQPGLFGQGSDERLHHAVSRVQAMLGHRGVVTPEIGGGRWLAERERRVPWGDRLPDAPEHDRPWPGSLPAPLPTQVYRRPRSARIVAARGEPVTVDERGMLSASPATIDGRPLAGWAGPWPIVERSWDDARRRRAHRFQLLESDQSAWLAVLEDDSWWIEGRYD